jgi:sugar (pentulose or hexulose) kinase
MRRERSDERLDAQTLFRLPAVDNDVQPGASLSLMTATRSLLVGVDVGSTMIKAGVVSVEGDELGRVSVPTGWRQVPTGAEIEPDTLLESVQRALARMLAAAPPGDIAAIGVTSMAETAILLDRDGAAIGPAIAWYDTRAAADYAQMAVDLSPDEIGHQTGLTAAQIPTVANLRWLMRAYPELRRAQQVLSVAEWVIYGLGGSIGAELSLASRTGVLSITSRRWWVDSLRWAGLGVTLFPELHPAGGSWGRIGRVPEGLERLVGATLTVAGHDHLTASVGSGVTTSSQLMNSCGTAEALIRPVAAHPAMDPGAGVSRGISMGWHALPDHYGLLGAAGNLSNPAAPTTRRHRRARPDGSRWPGARCPRWHHVRRRQRAGDPRVEGRPRGRRPANGRAHAPARGPRR